MLWFLSAIFHISRGKVIANHRLKTFQVHFGYLTLFREEWDQEYL